MTIIPKISIANDVWWEIGSFLSLQDVARFARTCTAAKALMSQVFEFLARTEQKRMKIQPFQLQLHHPNTVAKVWKKLPAESRRELAIALEDKPLVFYANIFDGITVLLRDDVIAANDDRHKLEQLAKNEVDNKKARFIAESIPRASFRYRALGELLGRSSVNLEDALRICEQIPDESKRDYALLRCYLQKKLSDQERNVILDKMSPGFFGFYQRTTMAPGMIMIEENKNSELIDRVLATAITCISLLAVLYSLYSWLDSR